MCLIKQIIPVCLEKMKKALRSMIKGRLFGVLMAFRLSASSLILGSERGMALITALVLGLVGMLMISSLLYLAGTGIWTSGSKNRYQTALETAHGGLTFFAREIIERGVGGTALHSMGNYGGVLTPVATDASFTTKLKTTGNYPAAPADATLTFTFAAPNPNINVNTTILSSSRGNSGTAHRHTLLTGGVATNNTGTVQSQHIPYLYQTEIRAQSVNAQENAGVSAIYVY